MKLVAAELTPRTFAVAWVFWPAPLTAEEEQTVDRLLTSIRMRQ